VAAKAEDAALVEQFLATRQPELREQMILRFVPLVHFVLGRLGLYERSWPEHEDLVSQGLLGLIGAVDRFDASYGTQFSTYATVRIRGQVLDYLRSLDWLPRSARKRARSAQEAITTLWSRLGRAPSEEEISAHLGVELEQLRQSLSDASRVILSLDAELEQEDGEDGRLHERLADATQTDPSDWIDERHLEQRLEAALKELGEREQMMLSLYYNKGLTMKEIGQIIGVSESRICQIHAQAVMGLRALLEAGEELHAPRGHAEGAAAGVTPRRLPGGRRPMPIVRQMIALQRMM
jgi:RNA polymerase sigma factor for flagellar operon FliA